MQKNIQHQGYVYAPYIPVVLETIISESGFSPSKSLKSRYSKVAINSMYGSFGIPKPRNQIRKEKIESIYDIKKPSD